jgi:hypothetical protein
METTCRCVIHFSLSNKFVRKITTRGVTRALYITRAIRAQTTMDREYRMVGWEEPKYTIIECELVFRAFAKYPCPSLINLGLRRRNPWKFKQY